MKKALITGITGQDGSYLAELLLWKGYEVHGLVRRASNFNRQRIEHIYQNPRETQASRLHLHYGDISAGDNLTDLVKKVQPDEIYHLAAQSHVRVSFDLPESTGDVTALGTIRMLEAMRKSGTEARFYQASSSEMFGSAPPPQDERTAFEPRSPYAVAKVYAFWITRSYREAYGCFTCNGILFNHESPRRGESFVTRKISCSLAKIVAGQNDHLFLGNLDAKRDWGYAPEYVEAMWTMLQGNKPEDLVIGTGEAHSVREFLDEAFGYVDLDWNDYVRIDPMYFRPAEVDFLKANASRARKSFGWNPRITFRQLVRIMVDADLELLGLPCPGEGREILKEYFDGWHRWDAQVITMNSG